MNAERRRGAGGPRIVPVLALVLATVVACVTAWQPPEQRYHRTAVVADAGEAIGAEECVVCHEDVQGHAPIPVYHEDCESCHGLGELHADSEEPEDVRYPSSADCLGCHEAGRNTHLAWSTGEHERAGVICSDCHNAHNREPLHIRQAAKFSFGAMDANSSLCIQCHMDVASRLNLPSHHPVREGMLSCTDCHAPHGDRRTALGDRVSLCAGCHQDYVGPWIWEHAPVAEDCTMCHNPHGAAAYNLLDTSQPALCLSCHSIPQFPHVTGTGSSSITKAAAATYFSRCTDCHGAIHGSYQDPQLFQ